MTALPPDSYRHNGRESSTKGLWCIAFVGFAAMYLLTGQRGVSWQDSGMFQWRVLSGDWCGELGLALAHPLYIAAGRVLLHVPIGDFPARLNAFSGLGMAVALANLAAIGTILTGRRWIGLSVAAMVAVAHTAWWLSTIAEVYTWSVAGLTAEIWLLVMLIRRPGWAKLCALALVSGLGLCVHNFALLPLPVHLVVAVVLMARKKLPAWSLAAAAGAYVLGAGLYLGMIAELAMRTGDLAGAIRSALVGEFAQQVLNTQTKWRFAKQNAALGALNFASFLLPLAVIGWACMRRRIGSTAAAALGAITAIEIVFVLRYSVPDQFTFLLPSLVMIAVASAVGLAVLADKSRRWRAAAGLAVAVSIVGPPIIYGLAPRVLRSAGVQIQRERELPFRDEARYWLTPWKHNERSAERFTAAALSQVRPDGVILADSTSSYPLLARQRINGNAPLVSLAAASLPQYADDPQAFGRALGARKLFAVSPVNIPQAMRDDPNVKIRRRDGEALYRIEWSRPGEQ